MATPNIDIKEIVIRKKPMPRNGIPVLDRKRRVRYVLKVQNLHL